MKIYGELYHEVFNETCRDEVIGDAIRQPLPLSPAPYLLQGSPAFVSASRWAR